MRIKNIFVVFSLICFFIPASLAKNVIVFSTPPTQAHKATLKRYTPIAKMLEKATGKKVVLSVSKNFIEYSQNLIDNKYDLVFDGPQFIAWRMAKRNHVTLAKLPGKLRFVVVIRKDAGITKMRKLAGKRVCAVGSPNLLTLGFLDQFPDPASVPVIVTVKGFKGALKCVKKKQGVAAIFRDKFWNKVSKKPRKKNGKVVGKVGDGLELFFTAKVAWPHRGFSVSTRVDEATREKIRNALLSQNGSKAGKLVLKQFRIKSKKFVRATDQEYSGLGRLLLPIWGFHDQ